MAAASPPAPAALGSDQALLFIAAPDIDSNLYYACHFHAGDPVVYLEYRDSRVLLLNELELGRGRAEARVDRVVSLLPLEQELRRRNGPGKNGKAPHLTDMLELYLRRESLARIVVPASFPIGHADRLRAKGFILEHRDEPFFPQRAVKSGEEIELLAACEATTIEAMDLVRDVLRRSRPSGGVLELAGKPLTAEAVRREVQRFLFEKGYSAHNTIVAGGDQACDPHVRGSGPLPADKPIIVDIFPRSESTRYWGDMTRTFLRGKPNPEHERLHRDVLEACELGLSKLKDNADGQELHEAVVEFFKSRGRVTEERDSKMVGYFHSTGHGVGLDIHEYPKIGRVEATLRAGNAVTIEPGLYYFGLGGVRIEDLAVVTASGHRNLTPYPKDMVI